MITITTSNVNGIRAAKRKGIETWAGEHAPDIWCMQEVRAPQDELNPIFGEFGFEYAAAGGDRRPERADGDETRSAASRDAPASGC